MEPGLCRFTTGRVALGADLLRNAKTFCSRPDIRRNEGLSLAGFVPGLRHPVSILYIQENFMKVGVDYYPEHWDSGVWEDDAQRMQAAGITLVKPLASLPERLPT